MRALVTSVFAILLVSCGSDAGRTCLNEPPANCSAASCEDGSASAARLATGDLGCEYSSDTFTWSNAAAHCKGLGLRLPTKGEALAIASNRYICRSLTMPARWYTWTATCAGTNLVWTVGSIGQAAQGPSDGDNRFNSLCVR
jgi:hypothetical protein